MKPPSFLVKVAVGNLLAVAAVMALVSVLSYRSLDKHFQEENRAGQTQTLRWFQQHFEDLWPLEAAAVHQQCRKLAAGSEVRLTVIASDGAVLGDSERNPQTMELHSGASRPEIAAALGGNLGEDTRTSESVGTAFRYMAMPIRDGGSGKVVGVVRTAIPIRSIAARSGYIQSVVWWSALAAILATALLALLLSWWWYVPLRQITHAARRLASGNLSARAPSSWTTELSQLATALNEMRQNLSRQIGLIEAQREDLRAVVSNAREAILAADASGRVLLGNRAAVELLTRAGNDPIGQDLAAAVDLLEVTNAFNDAMKSGTLVQRQVETQRLGKKRVLDVCAMPMRGRTDRQPVDNTDPIAGLLVAYDITAIVQAASVRAEFAANASHELRTPLAILRGSVEALGRIGPADKDAHSKFVAMLDRQVKRLEDLTRDLLSLHAIESGKVGVNRVPVVLEDLADWAREAFAVRSAAKSLGLTVEASPEGAVAQSDRNLLEMILQNLLDNAVKFTPAGGRVACELSIQEECLVIRVTDTGCGIPLELQSRVFERFFQVDRGRSGEPSERGTGLGLAIVKHASERLGGEVELVSSPEVGTAVTASIPA